MKRFYLAILALAAICMGAQAQSSLLATLNHEGEISIFYGATALQQAHAAAAHGDVITLSSGTFASTDITKAVTLRGAGMTIDTLRHTEPTVLANDFKINVTDTISERLTMEGIYSNQNVYVLHLKNALFLKCRFKNFSANASSVVMKDLNFIHCRISERFSLAQGGSVAFTNSVVLNPGMYNNSGNGYFSLNNCYVDDASLYNSEYKNCIINDLYSGSSTSTYYNNLHIGNSISALTSTNTTNLKLNPSDAKVSHLIPGYTDDLQYNMTDELNALIKGTDGKEIGIHGGSLPYDPTPSNPQITKFNVAAKSTADGKLSVDIEIDSAE